MAKPEDKEPNYDGLAIKEVTRDLYHAISGKQPDDSMKARLDAGVDAVVGLYQIDPILGYAALGTMVGMAEDYLGRKGVLKDTHALDPLKNLLEKYAAGGMKKNGKPKK